MDPALPASALRTTAVTLRDLEATPPARALAATLWTVVALVAVLLAWSVTARLDIVATAPGKLVPASQVKTVQAADAGIVRAIAVRDGDRVAAGQVLVRLDATVAGADAAAVANELALKRLTVRAIDAALAAQPLAPRASEPAALYAQVAQQFSARRLALADALAQEQQAAARAASERHAAVQIRDKLAHTLPVVQQSADSYARLQQEGFVGELLANEKKKELVEREQDLKAQTASVQALEAAIAQAHQRSAQLKSSFRSQLLTERVEAQAAIERLSQEQAKLGFRAQQLDVKAPADGTVQDLALATLGAVVQAGTPLLNLVPQGDTLHAEALLANEDVGFVEVGQTARVKLAAYPFQKYGLLAGKVVQLSADAVDPQATAKAIGTHPMAAPALAYKAVIELDRQRLSLPGGGELKIAPGMAITAEIHQGRRTVMEYLLSPVQRVAAEAGRER